MEIKILKDLPESLKDIPDSPERLFIRGDLPKGFYITFVGTRAYTNYGKRVCEHLIRGLSGHPIVIVSGMALGIDSIAHRSAINNGLKTVAVLPSGLDDESIYPRSHKMLAKEIIDGNGAIVSEYEKGHKANAYEIPKRNRIIAGLSELIVVIECSEKSGTMITAKLALDYNRDVGVVMHDIFSPTSGAYSLLRDGAHPINSVEDIFEIIGMERNKAKDYSLTENEKILFDLLSSPKTREDLGKLCGLSPTDLNIALSSLELKNAIQESLGLLKRVE